jgi:hypothetical protein
MKKSFLFILGLTALFTGCTQEDSGKNERGVIELSPVEKSISKQSNDFAFGDNGPNSFFDCFSHF